MDFQAGRKCETCFTEEEKGGGGGGVSKLFHRGQDRYIDTISSRLLSILASLSANNQAVIIKPFISQND